jgi:hypothetical protein
MFAFGSPTSTVGLLTGSLMLKGWIFTVSSRTEQSQRPAYNFSNHILEIQNVKQDLFGGLQFAMTRSVLGELFYNYYLMHELSIGLTVFF